MKTKFNLWFAALCVLSLTQSGCKDKKTDDIVSPAPSYIGVGGTVMNEAGSPLHSIRMVASSFSLNSDNWWGLDKEEYSDKDGSYSLMYMSSIDFQQVKWPTELIITAQDTSGIYETQSQTFPIELKRRYPERKDLSFIYDAVIIADFVLQKK
ncbi:MAG: hypothetical protein IKO26_09965 [Paludibacteraceae bacterium]|nr:hypothetical protein [Paludibacteraceae bacterium]